MFGFRRYLDELLNPEFVRYDKVQFPDLIDEDAPREHYGMVLGSGILLDGLIPRRYYSVAINPEIDDDCIFFCNERVAKCDEFQPYSIDVEFEVVDKDRLLNNG